MRQNIMRQNRRPAKVPSADRPPRRRRNAELPPVPTFPADAEAAAATPPETEDNEAAEVVRRMVEAAYT
jgi:hypothetical protein